MQRAFHVCHFHVLIVPICVCQLCAALKHEKKQVLEIHSDADGKELASATVVLLHLVPENPLLSQTCQESAGPNSVYWQEAPRDKNMKNFRETLPHLHSRFLATYKYPVTLFYAPFHGVIDDIAEIKSLLPGVNVEAQPLDVFSKDRFYSPERYEEYTDTCLMKRTYPDHCGCSNFNFAYKQMNYVFTYGMFFDTDVLHKYRYWLRIDSDSRVKDVQEDPFQAMRRQNLTFAYREQPFTEACCTTEMPAKVEAFIAEHGIKPVVPAFLQGYMKKLTYFYGNIGAGNLEFFTSPSYKAFVSYLLKQGGVWKYRWDDQHIYAQAMAIFQKPSNVGPLTIAISHAHDRG
mmetsp:Transcript_117026/g.227548  ORF Transcript_117026/g.227548 Transcript_117026/m.227548 type:complete len:346 (+) Transcript_117026:85-1122(+)